MLGTRTAGAPSRAAHLRAGQAEHLPGRLQPGRAFEPPGLMPVPGVAVGGDQAVQREIAERLPDHGVRRRPGAQQSVFRTGTTAYDGVAELLSWPARLDLAAGHGARPSRCERWRGGSGAYGREVRCWDRRYR
ncbi:hypothetical protein GCM10010502_63700 [Kitasatospora aureofaciens]|uniref:Uncharacterized protein n=1 Tax=Kitasatospora aureofaciens TaxID=1894 RepID=A0A8H9I0F8_KITAU|nr:hypothetical protein GCM10010502_63700 [Kitasatospora aureofaciens]